MSIAGCKLIYNSQVSLTHTHTYIYISLHIWVNYNDLSATEHLTAKPSLIIGLVAVHLLSEVMWDSPQNDHFLWGVKIQFQMVVLEKLQQ